MVEGGRWQSPGDLWHTLLHSCSHHMWDKQMKTSYFKRWVNILGLVQNSKILTSGGELCHAVGPDLSNSCLHSRHYLCTASCAKCHFLILVPAPSPYSEEIHIWTQPLLKIRKHNINMCMFGVGSGGRAFPTSSQHQCPCPHGLDELVSASAHIWNLHDND